MRIADSKRRRLGRSIGLALVAAMAALTIGAGSALAAGPVILGGDDLTDHGDADSTTQDNREGWLYMQRALENLSPNVTRSNDNTVAALGSAATLPPASDHGGDAGAGVGNAAGRAGMVATYHNDAAGINQFFADLASGAARPKIIWVSGDNASNDLGDTGCEGPGTEGQAIIDHAAQIDQFVAQGGGLMSHGVCYKWLSALLPGLTTNETGGSSDLYFTPQGSAAFPGLGVSDINAGPWHNHFEGDFGGLGVLVRSNTTKDAQGNDAAVILGGSAVTITAQMSVSVAERARCARGAFKTRITVDSSNPIRRVRVMLDGKKIRETTKSSFNVRVRAGRLRPGSHTIKAIATDNQGTKRSDTTRFRVCAAQRPRFTG